MLKASHIKAWSKSTDKQKLDENNGLLLCAHHDALFDKYLLSFEDDGKPIISELILEEHYESLRIDEIPSLADGFMYFKITPKKPSKTNIPR